MRLGSATSWSRRVGVAAQVGDRAVERGGDRVEAAEQEQEAHVEHLLVGHALAVDLAVGEPAEQVVAGPGPPVGDDLAEEVVDGQGRAPADHARPPRGRAASGWRSCGRMMSSFHAEHRVELVERQIAQLQEDRAGQRHRQLGVEVAGATLDEPVDELVDQAAHLLVERDEVAGAQVRVHHPAVLDVVGRVDLQRQQRPLLPDVDGRDVGAEDLRVLEGELHVLVAADQVGVRHLQHRGDGHLVAQRLVERDRIGRHLGRVGVGRADLGAHVAGGGGHEAVAPAAVAREVGDGEVEQVRRVGPRDGVGLRRAAARRARAPPGSTVSGQVESAWG